MTDPLASEKALTSVDLLIIIFSYVSRDDAAHAALVCRGWLELARDVIWETIKKPEQLFSLLAPIETAATSEQRFTRAPSEHDWQRFAVFARRVRHLRIVLRKGNYTAILRTVASSMPSQQHFLPRLTSLVWEDWNHGEADYGLDPMHLFLVPSLRSIHMSTPYGVFGADIGTFFEGLPGRSPALEELTLRVSFGVESCDLEAGLCRLIRTVPLRSVDLPLYFFTPAVLFTAVQCPTVANIRTEEAVIEPWLSRQIWQPCTGFPRVMGTGAAAADIETLVLAIPLEELNILLSREFFSQLQELSL
ncbi:unnamed protein product [Peniophora sp. CBMAI 1063]|nr:unnamed protein product [Peniophora sp. CBMAI 1063]